MVQLLLKFLKKLLNELIKHLKNAIYQWLKRWALLGVLVLFLGFFAVVALVWVMVAGW